MSLEFLSHIQTQLREDKVRKVAIHTIEGLGAEISELRSGFTSFIFSDVDSVPVEVQLFVEEDRMVISFHGGNLVQVECKVKQLEESLESKGIHVDFDWE